MLERTKTRRTDAVSLRIVGPVRNRETALKVLGALGFHEEDEDSVPWREAFPEWTDKELPGVVLQGARLREDMTQAGLAEKTGIPQGHISEMENGKRPITVKTAKILAKTLNTGYKIFL